jgi:RNA polymerase sigma factor for flagellar operon FliA
MRELLADAIADLPERERLVFTLYYYEELETSEIRRYWERWSEPER